MEWRSEDIHVLEVGPVRITGTPPLLLVNSIKGQCRYRGIPVEFHGQMDVEGTLPTMKLFFQGKAAGAPCLQDHEVGELSSYLEDVVAYWLELPESRSMLQANLDMQTEPARPPCADFMMAEEEALKTIRGIPVTVDEMTAAIRLLSSCSR